MIADSVALSEERDTGEGDLPAILTMLPLVLIGKIRGLSRVKLIDASFIWTEPHSRRIKIKLTIQKEAFTEVGRPALPPCSAFAGGAPHLGPWGRY